MSKRKNAAPGGSPAEPQSAETPIPRSAAPAASPAHSPRPKCSVIAAAVHCVAPARAAAALRTVPLDVPLSRTRSCRRARHDST
eukprot:7387814-Prymnesium_polylepis.1